MSSGRRESVLLFCTSLISKEYLDPIDHYEPDVAHVFISDRDDILSEEERRLYESSKQNIQCKKIIEHRTDTSDYDGVLSEMMEIINNLRNKYKDDLDIFVNISSGTPEFSAAGMFSSMLLPEVTAFRTDTKLSMTPERLSELVGELNASADVSEPEMITELRNDRPDDEMIVFLTVVSDILKESKYPKFRRIIDGLKEAEVWSYDPDRKSGYGRTPIEEKEERYLKRHYIAIALENGWIERPTPNTMRLTDSGKAYISVYGTKDVCREEAMMADTVCRSVRNEYDLCRYSDDVYFEREISPRRTARNTSNTVTFGKKGKRYTFTIGMDQHR